MNAETFLANFRHVAAAPDGVRSLRQLIMASALSGDFSSPNDDLPDDILGQIENARSTYLVKAGRREKPLLLGLPLITEFKIPRGWQWIRVGQVCDLQTGATPSRQRPEYFGGDVRWLVSGDINQGEIFDCTGRITNSGLENSNCKILPKDSVLIALNGQGKTRATVAILRVPAACNQSLVAMISFSSKIIAPEFLLLALRYRYFEIRDITGQDQRRGLNMGLVSELSIPLAPLSEQQRIVTKVNELMGICDRLETQQEERQRLFPILSKTSHERFTSQPDPVSLDIIFNKIGNVSTDDLRKSILTLAVQGRLLPQRAIQGRTAEKALAERRNRSITNRKSQRSLRASFRAVEESSIPMPVPKNWKWIHLGEIADRLEYGTSEKAFISTTGIPTLRMGNIQNGKLDLRDLKYIPQNSPDLPKLFLEDGDIIFNRTNSSELVGKAAVFRGKPDSFSLASYLIRVSLDKNIASPDFFNYAINSGYYRHTQIEPELTQQCGQANFSGSKLANSLVPLPPITEQHRIVAKVDQLMSLIDTLEKQQQERDNLAENFAKAVVTSLTGTQIEKRKEKMKAPKTELISNLSLGAKPKDNDDAPLAGLLIKAKGHDLPAKSMWQQSGLTIDAFYQQLKTEIARGWIAPPKEAVMKEAEEA